VTLRGDGIAHRGKTVGAIHELVLPISQALAIGVLSDPADSGVELCKGGWLQGQRPIN